MKPTFPVACAGRSCYSGEESNDTIPDEGGASESYGEAREGTQELVSRIPAESHGPDSRGGETLL